MASDGAFRNARRRACSDTGFLGRYDPNVLCSLNVNRDVSQVIRYAVAATRRGRLDINKSYRKAAKDSKQWYDERRSMLVLKQLLSLTRLTSYLSLIVNHSICQSP